jgi:hypothetical protein
LSTYHIPICAETEDRIHCQCKTQLVKLLTKRFSSIHHVLLRASTASISRGRCCNAGRCNPWGLERSIWCDGVCDKQVCLDIGKHTNLSKLNSNGPSKLRCPNFRSVCHPKTLTEFWEEIIRLWWGPSQGAGGRPNLPGAALKAEGSFS